MPLQRKHLPALVAALMVFAVSGCKNDLSKVTDEQLLALVGKDRGLLSLVTPDENEPVTISRRVRECAEILGGLNADIYKDAPEEVFGVMKVNCRKQISKWLADPKRNSTELQIADFDRRDLAERIIALAEKQDAAKEAAARMKREKEFEEIKAKLAEVTSAGQTMKAALIERQGIVSRNCKEVKEKRKALEQKNSTHDLLYQSLPNICMSESPLDGTMSRMEDFEKRLAEYTLPQPDDGFMPAPPSLPTIIDLAEIDTQITEVRDALAQYNAALAGN